MLHRMPTSNPRLTITLTPAVAAVLREMSALAGNSQSAIVGELLETSLPVFERVVRALSAAHTIHESARAEIAAGLESAQTRLEAQLPLLMSESDDAFRPLLEAAEAVSRRKGRSVASGGLTAQRASAPRSRAAPQRAADPRTSNRGVRSAKRGQQKGKKGAPGGRV